MQPHVGNLQHVVGAQTVPGIHEGILAKGHINAGFHEFFDPGHPAPFGVGVMAALEGDIDQRIGHNVYAGLGHQGHQFADIIIIHGMHGGEMGAGNPPVKAQALGMKGQRFDMARVGVVAFVTVHVDLQTAGSCNFAQGLYIRYLLLVTCYLLVSSVGCYFGTLDSVDGWFLGTV